MTKILMDIDSDMVMAASAGASTTINLIFAPNVYPESSLDWFSSGDARKKFLIGRNPSICNGEPVILGTRISVANIIERYNLLGWDIEKILSEYSHLNETHVKASLEYYDSHKVEIDKILEEEMEIDSSE